VIKEAARVTVVTETEVYTARVLGRHRQADIAILKIPGTHEPLSFAAGREARLGEEVITIGFPMPMVQGISPKVTKGIISGITGYKDASFEYQFSAQVQPGNSGGPLVDRYGNIVGMIVASLNDRYLLEKSGIVPQNVNFASKSAFIRGMLAQRFPALERNAASHPLNTPMPFEDVVEKVVSSAVLILVK